MKLRITNKPAPQRLQLAAISSLFALCSTQALAQRSVVLEYDFATHQYRYYQPEAQKSAFSFSTTIHKPATVSDQVSVRVINVNRNIYDVSFIVESVPAPGAAYVDGLANLLKASGGAAGMVPGGSDTKTYLENIKGALGTAQGQFVSNKARNAVTALRESASSAVSSTPYASQNVSEMAQFNVNSKDDRAAFRKFVESKIKDESNKGGLDKLLDSVMKILDLIGSKEEFMFASASEEVTKEADVRISAVIKPKSGIQDTIPEYGFVVDFVAQRIIPMRSVGLGYDTLNDGNYLKINNTIVRGATGSALFTPVAYYHVPITPSGGGMRLAASIGAGLKGGTNVRVYSGLSVFCGDEQRVVLTLGMVITNVTRLNGYKVGDAFTGDAIPTTSVSRDRLYFAVSFRQ